MTITLKNIYDEHGDTTPDIVQALYDLHNEVQPEESISHTGKTPYPVHEAFVRSKPYREWHLILDGMAMAGSIMLTDRNEISIRIARTHQGRGVGPEAVIQMMSFFPPLPAIPSKRPGYYVANINPANQRSRAMFEKLGGVLHQVTYRL